MDERQKAQKRFDKLTNLLADSKKLKELCDDCWTAADNDENRRVTLEELTSFIETMFEGLQINPPPNQELIISIMDNADKDRNGSLSKLEFVDVTKQVFQLLLNQTIKEMM